MPDNYPLPSADPASLGFAATPLQHIDRLIRRHLEEDRYPGAQIALARHGKLALFRTYGDAKTEPRKVPATDDTLFLLFSQTKVLTSSAVWVLVEEGKLSFMDRIADHLPEFAQRGKGEITLHQVMSHQGGFPSGDVTKSTWTDHARMRAEVCDFSLDWTPGSRLQYHPRAAHLTQAMVIESVTGQDYRDVIREKVLAPLGLANEIFVGVPASQQERCADTYAPEPRRQRPDPRPRHDRRARNLWARRRRDLVFLGGPDERRVVHLHHQLHVARPLPFGAARPGRQPGPRGHRLITNQTYGPAR